MFSKQHNMMSIFRKHLLPDFITNFSSLHNFFQEHKRDLKNIYHESILKASVSVHTKEDTEVPLKRM